MSDQSLVRSTMRVRGVRGQLALLMLGGLHCHQSGSQRIHPLADDTLSHDKSGASRRTPGGPPEALISRPTLLCRSGRYAGEDRYSGEDCERVGVRGSVQARAAR